MGKWACQRDISTRPSWGPKLTYEIIPVSLPNPKPKLHSKVLSIFSMYVWDSIGDKTLSTFLNSSWESGRVNVIFLPDLAGDLN